MKASLIECRHSTNPARPETIVEYRAGTSLYRAIVEASELFKAQHGKHPNFIRLSERARAAHGSFVTGIIRAMLLERGVAWEVSSKVKPYHLHLLLVERPELEMAQ